MTIRVYSIAYGLLLLAGGLSASSFADGTIYHQAPVEAVALEPLTLEAVIEVTDAAVASASIYYRPRGQETYQEVPMSSAAGNLFFGTIPAAEITELGLEYYLVALLDDESVLAYPVDDPEVNPVFVTIKSAAEGIAYTPETQEVAADLQEVDVLILSPEPGDMYLPDDVVIAVSFFNVQDLDVSSIRLLVDRQDVTTQADVTADLVTYTPPALRTGAHQVELQLNRSSGSAYEPVAWRFLVTQKAAVTTEQAFRQSGSITPTYRRDDIDEELLEVSSMRLSYRGGWDWLRFRANMKLTSEQDPYKPHRNRFSASFSTPLLTLGIGDVTPRLDRFSLDGKRLRGYDANFTLGIVNLRVAKGELERGIQGRPDASVKVTDHNLDTDSLTVSRAGYAFRRDILAVRPSFGSGQRFELAFSLIKAKDNIASVNRFVDDGIVQIDSSVAWNSDWIDNSTRTITYRDLDNLVGSKIRVPEKDWEGKSPQDNVVIGSSLTFALNQRRFVVQSGFALSMLNKNIWDPVLSKKELDTFAPGDDTADGFIGGEGGIAVEDLPIDPGELEDYFHINLNQVPLLPIAIDSASFASPLKLIANMPSLAYHATAKFNYLRNFITLEYQQVGPEFNSLANPNLQKNVRVRSISDRIRLFESRLFISALYRATDDNIVKVEDEPITSTKMINLSANLNLGRGLPSLVLGRRTYERNNGIDTASADLGISDRREHAITKSQNLGLSYRLQMLTSTHDLNLNLAATDISDNLKDDRRVGDTLFVAQSAASNVFSLTAVSRFPNGLETNVVVSTNNTEISGGKKPIIQDITSLDLMARLPLLKGKLRARGGVTFRSNKTNQDENPDAPASFTRFGINGGASFQLVENLRLVGLFKLWSKTLTNQTEPFVDLDGDGIWSEEESYTDRNGNGVYDEGPFDLTLPSTVISTTLEYTF
ncbi:MAG: hypothetical protein JSU77_01770 [Fidelibacterota bacterium]|nr:MAG: hypothetical protein JSU77_01770 [Candidatus Neomarinimicrobiota bacterium]